ncbi:inositol-3-phosphate synthase [Catellatospora methionotrophica]|uniref:inositol-3-phosphate synthase n=1 Tax=Catellatospora methionotrophica TaxID=121620 RepID=UPI0034090B48
MNVGIVGIGNCAASLVQGVAYYRARPGESTGLSRRSCAGLDIADIRFTAAFDVNTAKIGRDLADAIEVAPNNALRLADLEPTGVRVREGALADGIGTSLSGRFDTRGDATADAIAAHLVETGTEVVVNFVPVGSQRAAETYAAAALAAGCAFVNCMPAVIARSPQWADRFAAAGVPLIGDDLTSQFGSTLVHHALVGALRANGVHLDSTYQLNSGGNMDFLNMRDPDRLATKQETKTRGFGGSEHTASHVGMDYVPFLQDRKIAFIRVAGVGFAGTPVEVDLRMSVEDSPSGAGNVCDAVRYAKALMAAGQPDAAAVSALLMKAPPRAFAPGEAQEALDALLDDSAAEVAA